MDTDEILQGRISQKDLSARYSWFEDTKHEYIPDESVVNALRPLFPATGFSCGDGNLVQRQPKARSLFLYAHGRPSY
jgi:hypothetical protein